MSAENIPNPSKFLRITWILEYQELLRMATLTKRFPVVLCGRSTHIGKPVSEALQPEYEVIHFIQSIEAAQTELPHLLAGRDPHSPHVDNVGTHNYGSPASAVIFGRGYNTTEVEQVRRACAGRAPGPVAWVAGDPAKQIGASGPPPGPGYARVVAGEVKGVLGRWKREGSQREGFLWY
ncbi:hypothetical protein NUU61_002985 [Penicillium alfredii]|uniref:Uncharacterized protein n=1 Tax=Penicillium alfredii TaxID=1506179 RepID=A0A9W9FSN0_9EURO|nr:uncharacterized protein NUU61_002985 [Penicillium alfredii]KAJ5105638.1 hypothetical protein NUU61_002985 [Penicillium alfredii]